MSEQEKRAWLKTFENMLHNSRKDVLVLRGIIQLKGVPLRVHLSAVEACNKLLDAKEALGEFSRLMESWQAETLRTEINGK